MALARTFCLIGAALDAVAAAALLSPPFARRMLGPADEPVTPALLYAMRTGAALTGWLVAWRVPMERSSTDGEGGAPSATPGSERGEGKNRVAFRRAPYRRPGDAGLTTRPTSSTLLACRTERVTGSAATSPPRPAS